MVLPGWGVRTNHTAKAAETMDTETDPFPTIEPWDEPVEGARLLDELRDLIRQYVVLPDHAAEVLALFVAHT